ncbi:MAG: trigger factor [Thermomicrobiales bacterium]
MKTTVDRLPKSVVTLDIASDPEEFAKAVDTTMRDLSRDAVVPGFRKGKAPRHIIERMVGREAIVAEAGRNMMDDLYKRALEEEDLQPISEPSVDVYNEEPLAFKVVVEVFPTVELGDYKSVRVETRDVELDDEEVEQELQALLKNHAEWIDVEEARQPQDGDQVTIDLEVFEGDEHFQEPAEDAVFVLGESNLFDSLVEAMKMMTPGSSSELTLAFEDDDTSVRPTMRGKTLRYAITLKEIKRREMPELNDEFAAGIGEGQFETVEALREGIAEDVLRQKAMQARTEVFNEIVEGIVGTSEVDVPDTLIESELDDQVNQLRTRLAQQGLEFSDYLASNGQTEADFREELRESAGERVRNTLVLQEVAKAEGLEVTQEDYDAEIEKLIAGRPNPEQLRSIYDSDYFRGMLENEIHDRKMMELVVEIGTEGKGAISGPGAELLEADEAPPVVEDEAAAEDEADDADAIAAGPVETEEQASGEPEASAETESGGTDDAPIAEAEVQETDEEPADVTAEAAADDEAEDDEAEEEASRS